MSTITKEVEIEIEYDEIREAVSDLSSSELNQLIEDCELAENIKSDISDDLVNFIDENCNNLEQDEAANIINAVFENTLGSTSDLLNRVIGDLDEDIVAELNLKTGVTEGVSETQKEFLEIVSKYLDEDKMKKVITKHRGGSELVEFFLLFIAK